MLAVSIRNPELRINPGGKLAPGQVVGRDTLIGLLWRTLKQQSVLLGSERRMGKTSIMRKMTGEAPTGTCVVNQSLQGINTPEEFARRLVAAVESNMPDVLSKPIVKRLRKAGVKKVGAKSIEVEFEPTNDEAWKDVVIETFESIDSGVDEAVIFFWDELPHTIEAVEAKRDPGTARDLLDVLRYVRETYSSRMLLSGSLGMHHVVDRLRLKGGSWAPTNDMAMIDVAPLSAENAAYLAIELLHNEGVECDDRTAVAEAIAVEVDCVPFYVHHTVKELQLRQEGSGEPIDVAIARGAVEAVLKDPRDPWQLKHYVDRVPNYYPGDQELALAVLDIVAVRPETISHAEIDDLLAARILGWDGEQLHNMLELLCKDHYIEPGYRFRLDLVRRAWLERRPPQ